MRNDFESNYLAHFQRLGAHWGEKNGPPYPLDRDQLTPEQVRKAKGKFSLSKLAKDHKRKKNLKKARKVRAKNIKEQKKEAKLVKKQLKEDKKFAKEKDKILKSGDAKEILKYKDKLSDQEFSNALNRVRNDIALREIVAKSEKSGFDKIDDIMNTAGKVTDWAQKGVKGYNTFAEIYNSVKAHSKEEQLPIIGKDNIWVQRQNEREKKALEREKDLINKAFTEKVNKQKNDFAAQLAKEKQDWDAKMTKQEQEWMEQLLKEGYTNVHINWGNDKKK